MEKNNKSCCADGKHLNHPQMEKKMPEMGELTNDCAPHLHHPQIPASKGHVEPQFNPKSGFKKPSEII